MMGNTVSKSKEDIEMDFDRAIGQAKELEDIAARLISLVSSNVEGTFAMLGNGFRGENSVVFINKGSELSRNMLGTADDLMRVSSNIKQTAEIIYKAEKAAMQICY